MTRPIRSLLIAWLAVTVTGCALLSKKPPRMPHYFTPLYEETARATASPGLKLKLGRVVAADNLRERIAYRTSAREIKYYDSRRWTERPDSYLQQALSRSLFEQHGLTMVVSGNAPTLQVDLASFEEIKGKPHRAVAEITIVLHHEGVAVLHETLRAEEQVKASNDENEEAEAVVQALSTALRSIVEQAAQRTMTTLSEIAAEQAAKNASNTQVGTPVP